MIRKIFLTSILFTSSCTINDVENYRVLQRLIFGGSEIEINQEFYDEIKYAFAKASLGRGDEVILILKSINGEIYEWVSEDGVLLYTKKGLIISTKGLEHDIEVFPLRDTSYKQEVIFGEDIKFKSNFLNPELYEIHTNLKFNKVEKINIDHLLYKNALKYSYTKYSSLINWRSDLTVITDLNGRPLFTHQQTHPYLNYISLEFYIK